MAGEQSATRSPHAFTVCDANYFVGAVALLNSLHISGNRLPLTVLDIGMTGEQRRLIDRHCEIIVGPRDRHPYLSKAIAPAASDADTIVLIDSDIVVTGLLTDGIAAAEEGKVYAFVDPSPGRWFEEWHDLLGLSMGPQPKFVRRYADLAGEIRRALTLYIQDVQSGAFPGDQESYHLPPAEQEKLLGAKSRAAR